MAGRFFNQRVKGSSTGFLKILIIGGIFLILLVVSVIILLAINKDDSPDPIISMREKVTIEINSELPDKELFFSELQNVDADDINISFNDVRREIENMSALPDTEIEEILHKIDELEKIVKSSDRKSKKWENAKGVIKWIADKGVDVGIALLPLLLQIKWYGV